MKRVSNTQPVDPTELRELRARASRPVIGAGTPPHGTKPTDRPTSQMSPADIRALIVAPTSERQTTEPLSILDLERFTVTDRTPIMTEELTPLDLARLVVEPRPVLATDEMSPLDHADAAVADGALRSEARAHIRTEQLSPEDLVRLVVPDQPRREKFTALETSELLDMLPTDQMTPIEIKAAQEPPRKMTAAGEIDVRTALDVVSLPVPERSSRRSSNPTWQVPRAGKMSARSILRLLFGRRR